MLKVSDAYHSGVPVLGLLRFEICILHCIVQQSLLCLFNQPWHYIYSWGWWSNWSLAVMHICLLMIWLCHLSLMVQKTLFMLQRPSQSLITASAQPSFCVCPLGHQTMLIFCASLLTSSVLTGHISGHNSVACRRMLWMQAWYACPLHFTLRLVCIHAMAV